MAGANSSKFLVARGRATSVCRKGTWAYRTCVAVAAASSLPGAVDVQVRVFMFMGCVHVRVYVYSLLEEGRHLFAEKGRGLIARVLPLLPLVRSPGTVDVQVCVNCICVYVCLGC